MKKIIDLKLNIDGLIIDEGKTVEEFVKELEVQINSSYPIKYEVLYEENFTS